MPASLRPFTLVCVLAAAALIGVVATAGLALAPVAARDGDRAYRALPALPVSAETAVGELETQAVRLADALHAVPVAAEGRACPAERLRVSWDAVPDGALIGAHLEPLGPTPTPATLAVNGIVRCDGADHAYMGFEAWRDGEGWRLAAVPFVGEPDEDTHGLPVASHAHQVEPVALPSADAFTAPVDDYAAYEPQRTCDPAAKPGTSALAALLTGAHPGTRDLGIARDCDAGGQSEHKEGRAFDWGVLVDRPEEKAAADAFVDQLMATDADGNAHALARRMGIMYVIWDGRIWSSQRAAEGWRAYGGASPHADHVHLSLSWPGALGRTSFWSQTPTEAASPAPTPPAPRLLTASLHGPASR